MRRQRISETWVKVWKPKLLLLSRALRADHRAIFENDIGFVGHFVVFDADVGGGGVAPPIEGTQVTFTEDGCLIGARIIRFSHAAAEGSSDADGVFDDRRERFFLVDEIEEQSGVAGGDVEVAWEGPSVPAVGGKRFAGAFWTSLWRSAEGGVPVVVGFVRLAGIDDDPACRAGAEGTVGVAGVDVVFAGRAFVGGEEVGFHVRIGADDDAVIAARVRYAARRGLDGVEGFGPGGAVGIVAEFGDVDGVVRVLGEA